jgi:3-deoxy-D-manno-octulosonate cytidylyltransferase
MKKSCICIPARLNSTRFDRKLLCKFGQETCIEKTVKQCLKVVECDYVYVLTDSQEIVDAVSHIDSRVICVVTTHPCRNGTERISRYIDCVPKNYKLIVNVQGDEPFVDPENIDHAIKMHSGEENVFYTTLHENSTDAEYLKSTSCVKVVTDNNNNALMYSRSLIPCNKSNVVNPSFVYKIFTGIYVFNRDLLAKYCELPDTELQLEEDVEQLKILEHGYKIKSYPTIRFNEVSLNTQSDYKYLLDKYCKIKLVVFDLDGVFTDGKIYTDNNNTVFKSYNGKDSFALKLLKSKNIKTGLITADSMDVVKNMKHIHQRMDYVAADTFNKLPVLEQWMKQEQLDFSTVAYIGDDLPDIEILSKVRFSACPQDAVEEVRDVVNYVCKNKGGQGAVREFVNCLINSGLC